MLALVPQFNEKLPKHVELNQVRLCCGEVAYELISHRYEAALVIMDRLLFDFDCCMGGLASSTLDGNKVRTIRACELSIDLHLRYGDKARVIVPRKEMLNIYQSLPIKFKRSNQKILMSMLTE